MGPVEKNVHSTLEPFKTFFDGLADYKPQSWFSLRKGGEQPTLERVNTELKSMRECFRDLGSSTSLIKEGHFDCFHDVEAFKLVFKSIVDNKNINPGVKELVQKNLNKLDGKEGSAIICDKLKKLQTKDRLGDKDFNDLSRMLVQSKIFLLSKSSEARSLSFDDNKQLLISLLDLWDAKIPELIFSRPPMTTPENIQLGRKRDETVQDLQEVIETAYTQFFQQLAKDTSNTRFDEASEVCLNRFFEGCVILNPKNANIRKNILDQVIPFYKTEVKLDQMSVAMLNRLEGIAS